MVSRIGLEGIDCRFPESAWFHSFCAATGHALLLANAQSRLQMQLSTVDPGLQDGMLSYCVSSDFFHTLPSSTTTYAGTVRREYIVCADTAQDTNKHTVRTTNPGYHRILPFGSRERDVSGAELPIAEITRCGCPCGVIDGNSAQCSVYSDLSRCCPRAAKGTLEASAAAYVYRAELRELVPTEFTVPFSLLRHKITPHTLTLLSFCLSGGAVGRTRKCNLQVELPR